MHESLISLHFFKKSNLFFSTVPYWGEDDTVYACENN